MKLRLIKLLYRLGLIRAYSYCYRMQLDQASGEWIRGDMAWVTRWKWEKHED